VVLFSSVCTEELVFSILLKKVHGVGLNPQYMELLKVDWMISIEHYRKCYLLSKYPIPFVSVSYDVILGNRPLF